MTYTEHRRATEYLSGRKAESLPSVEDWIKSGGQVQFPNSEPRQEKTMGGFNNTGKL